MKVYIAGKITGDKNYKDKFRAAEEKLEEQGHIVLNPARLPEGMHSKDYMRICLAMLESADIAVFLPDWEGSEGATLEADWCRYTRKPTRVLKMGIEELERLAEELNRTNTRWIKTGREVCGDHEWICSACGETFWEGLGWPERTRYCPKCGMPTNVAWITQREGETSDRSTSLKNLQNTVGGYIETVTVKPVIEDFPDKSVSGAKRCNLNASEWMSDWFVGTGKDEFCYLEGSWWDMICLARNILASENTGIAAPEFYRPEWKNTNYCGEECPYDYPEG